VAWLLLLLLLLLQGRGSSAQHKDQATHEQQVMPRGP
jgi:hypothetical protein